MLTVTELFDLEKTIAKNLLANHLYPWEALSDIKTFVLAVGPTLPQDRFCLVGNDVWIAKSASLASSACINGPCIIDENAEIRHCAYLRGSAIIGKGCVVGNSTEIKNAVLFDKVQVPHYNYVGDSILGYASHMGAGAVTSNVKSDKTLVFVHSGTHVYPTGLKKFGAILGDFVEVGCNSVLCPGTVVGKRTNIYPTSLVRGVIPADHIFKSAASIVQKIEKK